MARVSGRRQSEREVPCIDDGWDRDSLVPVFPNTFTNVDDSESGRGGVGCVERKDLFTVRVKDGRQYTSERLLSEKLKVFVEDLQLNAHLLKLIDPEEVIVRLVLVGRSDGDNWLELDGALTLGDVRMCMVVGDVLEAVLAKTTPPATVSSIVQGQTNITEHVTDTQSHNQLYPASAYANAPTWVVDQSDDRAFRESLTDQRKRRPSSLWASMAPSLPVVPSWSKGTSWLPSGNSEQDHLALINAIKSLPGVLEFTDSSSNSNVSASLGISATKLKSTSSEHGLVRWPRRRDHDHRTYFGEALDYTTRVLQEAGEFLASLQRLEELELRSVDQGNADLAGARGEIVVQSEGNEVVETCMSEPL